MLRKASYFAFIIMILFSTSCFAAAPKTLNFQGRLVEQDGTPVQGIKQLVFKIYDDPTAGTLYWQETQSSVALDSNGVFNVVLGKDPANPLSKDTSSNTTNFFNKDLYVEIIYSGQTFNPRQELTAVPYAMQPIYGGIPIGGVIPFAGIITPEGYLECAGQTNISQADYYDLYIALGSGTVYGSSGSNFTLPDYRGYFVRGRDAVGGMDPDQASRTGGYGPTKIGSTQPDEYKSHYHYINANLWYQTTSGWGLLGGGLAQYGAWNTEAKGGNETRPKNIYAMYIIRAN